MQAISIPPVWWWLPKDFRLSDRQRFVFPVLQFSVVISEMNFDSRAVKIHPRKEGPFRVHREIRSPVSHRNSRRYRARNYEQDGNYSRMINASSSIFETEVQMSVKLDEDSLRQWIARIRSSPTNLFQEKFWLQWTLLANVSTLNSLNSSAVSFSREKLLPSILFL